MGMEFRITIEAYDRTRAVVDYYVSALQEIISAYVIISFYIL